MENTSQDQIQVQTNKLIGRNILRRRKAKGWTQEQLGEMVGIKYHAVDSIERGMATTVNRLILFAKALGCEPVDLMSPVPAPLLKIFVDNKEIEISDPEVEYEIRQLLSIVE